MELEGRITSSMSLPEVLQFLGMGKMTGVLTINHGDYTASLVLRRGKLVNSSSMGRPRRLGQMLIHRNLVDRNQIEEALAYQQDFSPDTPLGQILVERRYITQDQLRQAIRLQLEEELWELFALQQGTFKFEHGDEITTGAGSVVELEIEPLLIEGARRMDEWVRIVKNIPSDEVIPAVIPLEDASERETLQLSDAEWQVLSLINGTYNIGCIASRSGTGKFETFRIINSFMVSGIVRIQKPSEPAPATIALDQPVGATNGHRNGDDRNGSQGESASAGSSARLASLFARWRSESSGDLMLPPDETPPKGMPGPLNFQSPVSFVAAVCNTLLADLMRNPDFIVDPRDERLAERYWQPIVMEFPRADLVTVKKNVLQASAFDRYIVSVGVEGPMKPIYRDTMEALCRYLRTLYLLTAQRLGTKNTRKVFATVLEDFRQRSKIGNSEDFFFNEYAARALA